jgi:hypothetical protein
MSDYTFNENWDFQQQYLLEIKRIIVLHSHIWSNARIGTTEEDLTQATDLVALSSGASFAVRIRRCGYDKRYKDLTIRSYNHGNRTEIDKLRAGYGDYYLYCWTDCDSELISSYWLIDLAKLRAANLLDKKTQMSNHDGTGFIYISRKQLIQADALLVDWQDGRDKMANLARQMSLF